jgi:hypothetical protein
VKVGDRWIKKSKIELTDIGIHNASQITLTNSAFGFVNPSTDNGNVVPK